MKKKIVYFCIIIAVFGASICLSRWWKAWRMREYGRGHALSYMSQARWCIYLNIQETSFSAPRLFISMVGNGLMVNSTNLPLVIITNAIFDASQVAFLDFDMWHHPYNISIMPFKRSPTNILCNVEIWSNGPHGTNENRGGDDLCSTNPPLEIDLTQLSN